MEPLVLLLAALGVSIVAVGLSVSHRRRRRAPVTGRQRRRDSAVDAVRATADADMEQHDIDDMLDAIAARRRARGRPELGEELARQLLREARDD